MSTPGITATWVYALQNDPFFCQIHERFRSDSMVLQCSRFDNPVELNSFLPREILLTCWKAGNYHFCGRQKRWHVSTLHVPLCATSHNAVEWPSHFAKEILLSDLHESGKLNRSPLLTSGRHFCFVEIILYVITEKPSSYYYRAVQVL
jgi:hypothetical protein